MAKKDDKKIKGIDQPESAGSKLVTALIALIIIIIWLVVFAFLIKLDVGGIGSNVLYPVLKDVPLVNKILPSVSEEQQAEEGNYKYSVGATPIRALGEGFDNPDDDPYLSTLTEKQREKLQLEEKAYIEKLNAKY